MTNKGIEMGTEQSNNTSALIFDVDIENFTQKVIQASQSTPILVDFWAPWCEPCKQLGPMLEAIVIKANGAVKLAKMDIEKYPQIAGQLGVKSIPAVIAFKDGQPVDGFMGAVPESQITTFIERIAGPIGPSEVDQLFEDGQAALQQGHFEHALQNFISAQQLEPENKKVMAGIIQAMCKNGETDQAREIVDNLEDEYKNDSDISAAIVALELNEQASSLGDIRPLQNAVEQNPNDHQSRLDLAIALNVSDKKKEAVDHLIEIVKRDREWQDDEARKQLLQFFEAWGFTDEMSVYGRRQLASLIFA